MEMEWGINSGILGTPYRIKFIIVLEDAFYVWGKKLYKALVDPKLLLQ